MFNSSEASQSHIRYTCIKVFQKAFSIENNNGIKFKAAKRHNASKYIILKLLVPLQHQPWKQLQLLQILQLQLLQLQLLQMQLVQLLQLQLLLLHSLCTG